MASITNSNVRALRDYLAKNGKPRPPSSSGVLGSSLNESAQQNVDSFGQGRTTFIPEERQVQQNGTIQFVLGNTQDGVTSNRVATNESSAGFLGFPEADMHLQVGRQIKTDSHTWSTSDAPGKTLLTIDTTEIHDKISSFKNVARYYKYVRFHPEIQVVVNTQPFTVGAVLVYYVPPDCPDPIVNGSATATWLVAGTLDYQLVPGRYPAKVLQVHKESSVTVDGYVQRPYRYINSLSNAIPKTIDADRSMEYKMGTFRVVVWNKLVPGSTGSCDTTVTVQTFLRLRAVSLRLPAVPRTAGLNSAVKSVVNTASEMGKAFETAFGALDRPDQPILDEWCVVDTPKPTCRLQAAVSDVAPGDCDLLEYDNLDEHMDLLGDFKIPVRISTVEWQSSQAADTVLTYQYVSPMLHTAYRSWWSKTKSVDPDSLQETSSDSALRRFNPIGMYWRGTIEIQFEFVKNPTMKGVVAAFLGMSSNRLPDATDHTTGFDYTTYFDISQGDTFSFVVPFLSGKDFVRLGEDLGWIGLRVITPLRSAECSAFCAVNTYVKLGEDFQIFYAPRQNSMFFSWDSLFNTSDALGWGDTQAPNAKWFYTKGVESLTEKPVEADAVTEQQPEEPTPVNADTEEMAVQLDKQTAAHPRLGGTKAVVPSWNRSNYYNWKMALQAPAPFVSVPMGMKGWPSNYLALQKQPAIVMMVKWIDLVRMMVPAQRYAYATGGIRLSWMATQGLLNPCIMTIETNGRMQPFVLAEHLSGTVTIPYVEVTPVTAIWASETSNDFEGQDYALQTVRVYLSGDITDTLKIHFYVSAADDFKLFQRLPVSAMCFPDTATAGTPARQLGLKFLVAYPWVVGFDETNAPSTNLGKFYDNLAFETPQYRYTQTAPTSRLMHIPVDSYGNGVYRQPLSVGGEDKKPDDNVVPVLQTTGLEEKDKFPNKHDKPEGWSASGAGLYDLKYASRRATWKECEPREQMACNTRAQIQFVFSKNQASFSLPGRLSRTPTVVTEDQISMHIHTDTLCCRVCVKRPDVGTFEDHMEHAARLGLLFSRSEQPELVHDVQYTKVSLKPTVEVPIRRKDDSQGYRHVYCVKEGHLYKMRALKSAGVSWKDLERSLICQVFPIETKGQAFPKAMASKTVDAAVDRLKEKEPELQELAKDVIRNTVTDLKSELSKELLQQKVTEVASQVGGDDKTIYMNLMAFWPVLAVKVPAYILQGVNAVGTADIVAILLHIVGDLMAIAITCSLVKNMLDALASRMTGIVNAIVGFFTKAGEDDQDEHTSMCKRIWEFVKPVGDMVGAGWGKFSKFVNYMKPVAALGQIVKGFEVCFTAIKGILNYFGYLLTKRQKKIRSLKQWFEEEESEIAHDLQRMQEFIVTGSVHLVSVDKDAHAKIMLLKRRAIDLKVKLELMRGEAWIEGITTICTSFLEKVKIIPGQSQDFNKFEPVLVMLSGPPGQGKSILLRKLAKAMSKLLCGRDDQWFPMTGESDYMTGYVNQQVIVIDDIFQSTDASQGVQLCQLISSVGYPIPQADIESKLCFSDAKIIICSSNMNDPAAEAARTPKALIRRWAATHFQSTPTPGKWRKFNADKNINEEVNVFDEYTEQEVLSEITAHFATKWRKHCQMQAEPGLVIEDHITKQFEKLRKENEETMKMLTTVGLDDDPTKLGFRKVGDFTYTLSEYIQQCKDPTTILTISENSGILAAGAVAEMADMDLAPKWHSWIDKIGQWDEKLWRKVLGIEGWASVNKTKDGFKFTGKHPPLGSWSSSSFFTDMTKDVTSGKYAQGVCWLMYWANILVVDALLLYKAVWQQKPKVTPKQRFVFMIRSVVVFLAEAFVEAMRIVTVIGCAIAALVVFSMIAAASAVMPSTKGAYDTRPGQRVTARQPLRTTGLDEKRPHIEKAYLKWTMHRPDGTSMSTNAFSLGDGFLLVNKHAIKMGATHTVTYGVGQGRTMTTNVIIYEANMRPIVGPFFIDAAVVYAGSTFPMRKNMLEYFWSDAQFTRFTNWDCQLIAKNADSDKFQCYPVSSTYTTGMPVGSSSWTGCVFQEGVQINHVSKEGDCGSVLVGMSDAFNHPIMGIVAASGHGITIVAPVTREVLKKAIHEIKTELSLSSVVAEESPIVEMLETHGIEETKREEVRRLECPDSRPFPTENAQFVPVKGCPEDDTHVNHRTKISRVMYEDELIDLGVEQILGDGKNKRALPHMYKTENPVLGETVKMDGTVLRNTVPVGMVDDAVMTDAIDIVVDYFDKRITPCGLLDEYEVLNTFTRQEGSRIISSEGMNTNSAAGHTLDVTFGKHKRSFYVERELDDTLSLRDNIRERIEEIEQDLQKGTPYERIVEAHLKDELRSQSKTDKGRVRWFYVEDMLIWYLSKKYFGDFVAKFRSFHGLEGKHSVGSDPAKDFPAWGEVFSRHSVLAGDVSGWDTCITGWHISLAGRIIEHFYVHASPQDRMVRQQLLDHMAWCHVVFSKGHYVTSGLKSGTFATTEINSLIHILIIAYCFKRYEVYTPNNYVFHMEETPFLVNGDDSLISNVTDSFATVHDQIPFEESFRKGYEECGLTLVSSQNKNADPELMEIHEASYLKRMFKIQHFDGHRQYVPAMDQETIKGLVNFKRKAADYDDNLEDAMRFAVQAHDYETFAAVRTVAFSNQSELAFKSYRSFLRKDKIPESDEDKAKQIPPILACGGDPDFKSVIHQISMDFKSEAQRTVRMLFAYGADLRRVFYAVAYFRARGIEIEFPWMEVCRGKLYCAGWRELPERNKIVSAACFYGARVDHHDPALAISLMEADPPPDITQQCESLGIRVPKAYQADALRHFLTGLPEEETCMFWETCICQMTFDMHHEALLSSGTAAVELRMYSYVMADRFWDRIPAVD